jgi:hypothetical protein
VGLVTAHASVPCPGHHGVGLVEAEGLVVGVGVEVGVGVGVGVGEADGDDEGVADGELDGERDGAAGAELVPWAGPTRFGGCTGW